VNAAYLTVVLAVTGAGQPQKTAEKLHQPPLRWREYRKTLLGFPGQRAAMVARNYGGETDFVSRPAHWRIQFADETCGRFVMTQLCSGVANIMHQSRSLQNVAAGFPIGIARDSIE
jgi:hypothetical protein